MCLPYDKADQGRLDAFFNSEYYEPNGVLVAEADTSIVGFVIGILQGDTGWIPVFFVHTKYVRGDVGDILLRHIMDFFLVRGGRYAKVGPFDYKVRFLNGIDSRYTEILGILSKNGFEVTDADQVDIVKDLELFEMPIWVKEAYQSLHQENITFGFCEPIFLQKYQKFMMEHFPYWYDPTEAQVEPRLRILAFHSGDIIGFTVYAKEDYWYIWATGVRTDFRWKKIGSVLVFLALEEMKGRGASKMCISDCPLSFYKVVEGKVVRRYMCMGKALK